MNHTKSARFFEPIIAVKNDLKCFQRVFVSFQSTSSCNIPSVNSLNECTNFVEPHNKVRVKHKKEWVVEMSHTRRIYLAMYFWIDVLDGRIQNAYISTQFVNIGILL